MAQKPIFQFFRDKIKVQSKCATKFLCENFRSRVVEQSISYEITEKYRTESVSFRLKYWLKLTYPFVGSIAHVHSVSVAQ